MRIILAIDGSEHSEAAAHAVASQQWPRGSVIRLLTVVHGIYGGDGGQAGDRGWSASETPTFWDLVHEVNEDALRVNMRTATLFRDAGLAVEIAMAQGDPRMAIVEDAHSWSADLVVLGSHGRTAAGHGGLGSVAQYVLLNATCLVDIVPAERRHRNRTATGGARPATGREDVPSVPLSPRAGSSRRAAVAQAVSHAVRRPPQIRRGATPDRVH